jgi:conjugative relaxase-like TrwC/TraI family protein
MVGVSKMGAGQERYYLGKVAEGAEDYYSGKGEAEGYWLGDAAEDLGLQGRVEPAQLVAMLTGMDPATGEPLGLQRVGGKGPVPGFDLTFSAPKSVSLIGALDDDAGREIGAAHAAAVEAAFDYLQREACLTRLGKDGREFVPGSGFLAAAYVHRNSRAGDPQVHTHVLVANVTQGPDGKWRRLYHPAIFEYATTASYLYEATLRHELGQRLGVEWVEPNRGLSEIKGFEPEDLRHFSRRRQEILEAAGPGASAREKQVAALATRAAKDYGISETNLREQVRARAREIGLTPEKIRATMGHEIEARRVLTVEGLAAKVTAHASHFDRRDAIRAVADSLAAGAPAREIEATADAFLASEQVRSIGATAKGERFTTQRIWQLEQQALSRAAAMTERRDRAVVPEVVLSRTLAAQPSMKPDQEEMVRALLGGGQGLTVVVGEAGTGKTYATSAAAEGWAAAGFTVRAAASTWRAANVLRSEGLDATSLAKMLAEFDRAAEQRRPPLQPGSVLLVDEAGMIGSADLARLIAHAEAAEAKLVLIGDPAQLGEIEAGGLFASIAERTEAVRLHEVIRHSHQLDREGARRIRAGEGGRALAAYQEEGRVLVATDPAAAREAMVADWARSFGAGEDALMVAKRNSEVANLNSLAREVMRAEGRLGAEEIEVGGERFAAGDQVITRINDHRRQIYNRERWRVAEVDVEARTVALDGIDTARRVCVDSVFLGRVSGRDGAPALQHGYAATIYQAQGATADRAFVMADASMDRQEFYVALSRSREETRIYATPEVRLDFEEIAPAEPTPAQSLEHIARAAERDGSQVAAHEQALRSRLSELPSEELHRLRQELRSEAGAEAAHDARRQDFEQRVERNTNHARSAREQIERVGELPRRERKEARLFAESRLDFAERALRDAEAERAALPVQSYEARAELAVVDHLIAERGRARTTAAILSPPEYVVRELGDRPEAPAQRREWDQAVGRIERYREEYGIRDRDSVFGPEPKDHSQRLERRVEQQMIRASQRQLGRELGPELQRSRDRGIDLGIGR